MEYMFQFYAIIDDESSADPNNKQVLKLNNKPFMQNTNPPLIALKIMVSPKKKTSSPVLVPWRYGHSRPDNAAAADCASARSGRGLPADDQNEWNAGKNDSYWRFFLNST